MLTTARRRRKISRTTLAKKIGCSVSGLRGWENGVAPSWENFVAWASALDFDVALTPRDGL